MESFITLIFSSPLGLGCIIRTQLDTNLLEEAGEEMVNRADILAKKIQHSAGRPFLVTSGKQVSCVY